MIELRAPSNPTAHRIGKNLRKLAIPHNIGMPMYKPETGTLNILFVNQKTLLIRQIRKICNSSEYELMEIVK